eukprot:CFRG5943T1
MIHCFSSLAKLGMWLLPPTVNGTMTVKLPTSSIVQEFPPMTSRCAMETKVGLDARPDEQNTPRSKYTLGKHPREESTDAGGRVPNRQTDVNSTRVAREKCKFRPDHDVFHFPLDRHQHKLEDISQFAKHLLHRADLSRSVYIVALIYYRRTVGKIQSYGESKNCRKCLILGCIVLACKYVEDLTYLNKAWAYWGDVTISHLNAVEHWILQVMGFNVTVTLSEFQARTAHYVSNIRSAEYAPPRHRCSTSSLPGCTIDKSPVFESSGNSETTVRNRYPKICLTTEGCKDKFRNRDASFDSSDTSDPLLSMRKHHLLPTPCDVIVCAQPKIKSTFVAQSSSLSYADLQDCAKSAQKYLMQFSKIQNQTYVVDGTET